MPMKISVIIPALNEEKTISTTLLSLQAMRKAGHEIIVADGGSNDRTVEYTKQYANTTLICNRGRARQMNRGAAYATGDILLFLHADTTLPENSDYVIEQALTGNDKSWGYFDISLSGNNYIYRIIEASINFRSGITRIASGDQALFVYRDTFTRMGGFSDIELMEDIEFCRRLKLSSKPARINDCVITSSRRWENQGIAQTILRMWMLRLAYYCGVKPRLLQKFYR